MDNFFTDSLLVFVDIYRLCMATKTIQFSFWGMNRGIYLSLSICFDGGSLIGHSVHFIVVIVVFFVWNSWKSLWQTNWPGIFFRLLWEYRPLERALWNSSTEIHRLNPSSFWRSLKIITGQPVVVKTPKQSAQHIALWHLTAVAHGLQTYAGAFFFFSVSGTRLHRQVLITSCQCTSRKPWEMKKDTM